jgi:hypothetical protein
LRRLVGQRSVPTKFIVVAPPRPRRSAGLFKGTKARSGKQLLADTRVEGFGECVIRWLARAREVEFDVMVMRPLVDCFGGELCALVAADRDWSAAPVGVDSRYRYKKGAWKVGGRPLVGAMLVGQSRLKIAQVRRRRLIERAARCYRLIE